VPVSSEINTKHINTVCGRNGQFLNIENVGASSNQSVLKAELVCYVLYTVHITS
jgi:hypothetical protein